MTMGQGAHHLGMSPAPAARNSMSEQGIGASSLPAPPLVTTRAGAGGLAQGAASIAWAARGCGTRLASGRADHDGHRGALAGESGRGGPSRNTTPHRPLPVAVAASLSDVAAMHNLPQRTFRLNLRPGRAHRLSEAGRHWAPITRQRATREERQSGLAWPTYCNKPKGAPPIMDGMGRTVAHGRPSLYSGKRIVAPAVFRLPDHWRRRHRGLKVAVRPAVVVARCRLADCLKTDCSRCRRRNERSLSTHCCRRG